MPQNISDSAEHHANQRLRLEFLDGEIAEVDVIEVALPNTYDKTPESWGLVYDLISSNRTRSTPKGSAFWSRLDAIKSFEVLGKAER